MITFLAPSEPNLPHLHVAGSQASLPQELLHHCFLPSDVEILEGRPQLGPGRGCNLKMVASRSQCQPRNARSCSGGKDRTSDRTNSLRILSLSLRRALTSHPQPNACMSSMGFSLRVQGPVRNGCSWIHAAPSKLLEWSDIDTRTNGIKRIINCKCVSLCSWAAVGPASHGHMSQRCS